MRLVSAKLMGAMIVYLPQISSRNTFEDQHNNDTESGKSCVLQKRNNCAII